jgi:hypothetical protein
MVPRTGRFDGGRIRFASLCAQLLRTQSLQEMSS